MGRRGGSRLLLDHDVPPGARVEAPDQGRREQRDFDDASRPGPAEAAFQHDPHPVGQREEDQPPQGEANHERPACVTGSAQGPVRDDSEGVEELEQRFRDAVAVKNPADTVLESGSRLAPRPPLSQPQPTVVFPFEQLVILLLPLLLV